MAMDRFQLAQYKSDRLRELSGKMQSRRLQDEDRAWLKTARTRTAGEWTKADEDRARRIEREQVQDTRQSTLFDQGQEQYTHGLRRRPKIEERQDRAADISLREAERGPRPVLSTGYNPASGNYEQQLIDPYSGDTKPIKGGLQPVQARRLYDITSAEVSAWKTANFYQDGGQKTPEEGYEDLEPFVLRLRQSLGGQGGGQTAPKGGLRYKGGAKTAAEFNSRFAPAKTPEKTPATSKKKTIPGLY